MATATGNNNSLNWILVLISLFCLWMAFRSCNPPSVSVIEKPDNSDSLKAAINALQHERDSLVPLAMKKDSVRTEIVVRWRKIKGDTAWLPCDTILNIMISTCDSIISADSAVIADLKTIIKKDDTIIKKHREVAKTDSLMIVFLEGEVKRHKRHKRWLAGGLVLTTVGLILK